MGGEDDVLRRALQYPYERPAHSFTFVDGVVRAYQREPPPSSSRTHVVLAIGSNAAPEQLLRKFANHAQAVHVVRVQLHGMDVVYAALVAAYGSIPATVAKSAATVCSVHATLLPDALLRVLHDTERGYFFCRLRHDCGVKVFVEGRELSQPVYAYVARNGPFCVDGQPVALAEIDATQRAFRQLSQTQIMHAVRHHVRDALPLEQFILANVKHTERRRHIERCLASRAQLEDCWQLVQDLGTP